MEFKAVDIPFEVHNISVENEWLPYTQENGLPIFKIQISSKNASIHGLEFWRIEKGFPNLIRADGDIMIATSKWEQAIVLPVQNSKAFLMFSCQLFYTHAVQRRILYLHSSLVDFHGSGLMFLGPSGIGKTTQAELWRRFRGAVIINGDVVFVQETEKNFLGWGTPWHGSSPYCENASVPVRAMIILRQASENSIRELTGFEKVTAVSESVFYPRWLENGMELCLETLNHLLSAMPVYELSCRPDGDAVRLTEETIFK